MTIKILAFGIVKEIFQAPSFDLQMESEPTVAAVRDALEQTFPRLKKLASYMVAVNNEYAAASDRLSTTDEVAIIPPVSGG